jgi:hypothetical protein
MNFSVAAPDYDRNHDSVIFRGGYIFQNRKKLDAIASHPIACGHHSSSNIYGASQILKKEIS